jgi:hypothetical protein
MNQLTASGKMTSDFNDKHHVLTDIIHELAGTTGTWLQSVLPKNPWKSCYSSAVFSDMYELDVSTGMHQ